jgi:hypothetical protein
MALNLTFGKMPTREQFDLGWDEAVTERWGGAPGEGHDTRFGFGKDERLGDARLTRDELWAELQRASEEYQALLSQDTAMDPETVGDWISRVLGCLGIEWT